MLFTGQTLPCSLFTNHNANEYSNICLVDKNFPNQNTEEIQKSLVMFKLSVFTLHERIYLKRFWWLPFLYKSITIWTWLGLMMKNRCIQKGVKGKIYNNYLNSRRIRIWSSPFSASVSASWRLTRLYRSCITRSCSLSSTISFL